MSSINGVSNVLWSTGTESATKKSTSVADEFSNVLAGKEDASKSGGGDDSETKTILQRSVITASDGSQVIVLTQITVDASGKQIDSKVISRQKISSESDADEQKVTSGIAIGKDTEESGSDPNHATLNVMADKRRKEYEDNSVVDPMKLENIFKANI